MKWVNEKYREKFLRNNYPNDDVKIYSSQVTIKDKNISIFVFCCERLTQSKLVDPPKGQEREEYNDPFQLLAFIKRKLEKRKNEFGKGFWFRGTHPSNIEAIIQNGIEEENEYFSSKCSFGACCEHDL